jgi:hypothetical protein
VVSHLECTMEKKEQYRYLNSSNLGTARLVQLVTPINSPCASGSSSTK